jgi:transposase
VVLAWRKRIWRCAEPACVRTWTERVAAIHPRAVLTQRARAEACRRVGKDAHAVAAVARDLGVGWATVMRAVAEHGIPLVDDAARLEGVVALGLDETSFLKATRLAPTQWVTGLVDLEGGRLLDLVADRTRAAVDGWLQARPRAWLAQVATVALDPWRGYASALVAPLGHATVVVDHFHAIRLANAAVDQARRRTQQATLGHRGRKYDPLYHVRKLLLTAAEQLTQRGRVRLRAGLAAGDPTGEVAAAWQGKELLRAVYAAVDPVAAHAALERFYHWSDGVNVAELSRLARTVKAWEVEILAFHATDGCSNGPTEAINLLVKKVKRVGQASATSPTTACGSCSAAASRGRLTGSQGCGAAHHVSWRRAPKPFAPQRSHRLVPMLVHNGWQPPSRSTLLPNHSEDSSASRRSPGQAGVILVTDFNGLLGRLVVAWCVGAGQVVTSAAPWQSACG